MKSKLIPTESIDQFIKRGGSIKKAKAPKWQRDKANDGRFDSRFKLNDKIVRLTKKR